MVSWERRDVRFKRCRLVAFVVDDTAREVLVYAESYAGADWIARSTARRR